MVAIQANVGRYMSKIEIPNPGSDAVIAQGCTCPVLENAHGLGRGTNEQGKPVFLYLMDCPLHGVNAPRSERQ